MRDNRLEAIYNSANFDTIRELADFVKAFNGLDDRERRDLYIEVVDKYENVDAALKNIKEAPPQVYDAEEIGGYSGLARELVDFIADDEFDYENADYEKIGENIDKNIRMGISPLKIDYDRDPQTGHEFWYWTE